MSQRKKTTRRKLPPKAVTLADDQIKARAPFLEHLLELRRRVFIIVASVLVWSGIAYAFNKQIIDWLLAPAHGQEFMYITPGGGIDFLIRVCAYTGVIMTVPVIIYQVLKFIEPLIGRDSTKFILGVSTITAVLAVIGVAFGYFFGLPTALGFLLGEELTAESISASITISSYLNFVMAYLAGASLIFQIPLWMYIINRIKPLKARTLAKNQRWAILISFIVAALINPSTRIEDYLLLALPMVLSYEVGVLLVWRINRKGRRSRRIQTLEQKDREAQAERVAKLATLKQLVEPLEEAMTVPKETLTPAVAAAPQPATIARPAVPKRQSVMIKAAKAPKITTVPSDNPTIPVIKTAQPLPRQRQYISDFAPKRKHF